MRRLSGLILVILLALPGVATVRLPALFSDHMVLQSEQGLPVWGWAAPGEAVVVTFHGQTARATADAQGRWRVDLPPLPPGGPFTLVVTGTNTVIVRDVLLGQVWLCAGQSNMEMPVSAARDAAREIAAATEGQIRFFHVTSVADARPRADVTGGWSPCTPQSVANFSAVAYYFARALHRHLPMPVGVIVGAWSGSPIEAWMSRDSLRADPDFAPAIAALDARVQDYDATMAAYRDRWAQWEARHPLQDPGNTGVARGWADPRTDVNAWPTLHVPGCWQDTPGTPKLGIVWLRRAVEIPAAWAGHDLALALGPCDDFDTTYYNGVRIGGLGPGLPYTGMVPRRYSVPAALVHAGRAVIAVRVVNSHRRSHGWHYGGGGLTGMDGQVHLAPVSLPAAPLLDLAGDWPYQVEHTFPTVVHPAPPPDPFGAGAGLPTSLFNGIIHGLVPYAIRGVAWYQGEQNVDRPAQYRRLLPALIADWRARWGEGDFPFYVVQLPHFGPPDQPARARWAHLREAQRVIAEQPENGLVVTLDLGEADNIHPANKQEVGRRLALCALERNYGFEGLLGSGPNYTGLAVEGHTIRLRFDHLGGGLVLRAGAGFTIAGDDRRFHPAQVVIDDHTLLVSAPEVPHPVAVRYAWADNPPVTLYNKAGLPASPFRTDAWDQ